jgi:moderate conductance mechanosensitive channel
MGPMVLAVAVTDFNRWARSNGLEIILLITGSVLVARVSRWFGAQVTARIDANAREQDALIRSEQAKHRHAVTEVATWTALVLIYSVTALLVLQRFGVPLTSLVAPATVAGVAVGFGAQRVVADLLSGFFLIAERQYGFGDVIRVSPPGTNTGVTGTVEDVTLRVTRLRTTSGELLMLPNGEIRQVTNLSRDWARAVIDVPVPAGTDIARATEILRTVCEDAFADEQLKPLLLDPPTVMGVESIEVDRVTIRLVARTQPGRQFEVGRELRVRVAVAFQEEGIIVPSGLETAPPPAVTT